MFSDLRHALRTLVKNPGFASVVVVTLALGIGANTAIFSVVNGVLLRPLSYKDPERIVTILRQGRFPIAPADFLDWRAQSQSFEFLAAAEAWGGTLTGGERPEAVTGLRITEELFPLLGVGPLIGRTFAADDYRPGYDRVLVLSYSLWQRRFGGRPDVAGEEVTLNGESYTVIGVMPETFRFAPFWATRSEMWAPLSLAERADQRLQSSLRIFARLKPNVTLAQAQSEMTTICRRLERAYPETNTGRAVRVDSLLEKVVGDIRTALLVLLAAVALVLLIACANVTNLLLVRSVARKREVAIRSALGANRWRIVRQSLTESLLLALIAGGLGVFIGFVGLEAVKGLLEGSATSFNVRMPRLHEISIDMSTLSCTLLVALLTGLLFGLVPALRAASLNLQDALKEGARGASEGRTGQRLRNSLVVSQTAMALIMLMGAGLLIRSFLRLMSVDPGFNPRNVLTMIISLSGQAELLGAKREAFYQQLFQRIEALPGVTSASAINHLPLAGDQWTFGLTIQGRPLPPPGERLGAMYRVCRPKYFETMGIVLARGRDFTAQDTATAPGVVVINESLARHEWPNEDPLGKRISLGDPNAPPNWLTIVGVVKDVKQRDWTADAVSEVYLPFQQSRAFLERFATMTLVVRSAPEPLSLTKAVQNCIWNLSPDVPVSSVATLEQVVANAVWQPRFSLILMGLFAGLALLLATLGLYGVLAYVVAQRKQEIGVRVALGASVWNVLSLVIGQGMTLAFIGVGLGLLGAASLSRLMSGLLFQVEATDPLTFLIVPVVLLVVALLACYLPARRATKVDPVVALRCE